MSDPHADHSRDANPPQPPGESPFGPGSPFAEHYRPPRLGIIHLLAWTAATAVLLKFSMAMEMFGPGGDDSTPVALEIFRQVIGFIYSTAHAAGIVATGVLVTAKARRAAGRMQPGHWMVLTETMTSLLRRFGWGLYVMLEAADARRYSSVPWVFVVFAVVELTRAGMYVYAAVASKDGKRWKICLAALAVVSLLDGIRYAGIFPFYWPRSLGSLPLLSLIVGLALLVAIVVDLRRGPRRDWLHWVGVAVVGTAVLVFAASWLWSMLAASLMW